MVRLISAVATLVAAASATNHMAMIPEASMWEGGNVGQKYEGASGQAHQLSIGITIVAINNGGGQEWKPVNEMKQKEGKVHKVVVGGKAGLIYSPSSINAEIGDIVQFDFQSKNHTLTQSTFPLPCKKKDDGMDSGFMPNAEDMSPPPAFKMQVMKKDPLWFYCKQKVGTHCGKGMVFSINPTAEQSQDAFLQAAIAQNGTEGAAAASGAPAAAGSTIVAPPASAATPPAEMAPPAEAAPPAAAAPPVHVAQGNGAAGEAGACSCSCLCGVNEYPSGMGLGMWGGMSGAMPMPVA